MPPPIVTQGVQESASAASSWLNQIWLSDANANTPREPSVSVAEASVWEVGKVGGSACAGADAPTTASIAHINDKTTPSASRWWEAGTR